jgi:hypothetical protein
LRVVGFIMGRRDPIGGVIVSKGIALDMKACEVETRLSRRGEEGATRARSVCQRSHLGSSLPSSSAALIPGNLDELSHSATAGTSATASCDV